MKRIIEDSSDSDAVPPPQRRRIVIAESESEDDTVDSTAFQSSITGFDWVTSDEPGYKPMITLRNPSPAWWKKNVQQVNPSETQPNPLNRAFKDGDVTVSSSPSLSRAVSVYGPSMAKVQAWWRKQDLGSPPNACDTAEKMSDANLSCVRPRYKSIFELFGGSAGYSSVLAPTNDVTVCEVGEMYNVWRAIKNPSINWADVFATIPTDITEAKRKLLGTAVLPPGRQRRKWVGGTTFAQLFEDDDVRRVMEKVLVKGATPQQKPTEHGIEHARADRRDKLVAKLNRIRNWNLCTGFVDGVKQILDRTTPCTVVIDPPYDSKDGDRYRHGGSGVDFEQLADMCIEMADKTYPGTSDKNQLIISESDRGKVKWYDRVIKGLNRLNIPWIAKTYKAPTFKGTTSFCEVVIVVNPDLENCVAEDMRTNDYKLFRKNNLLLGLPAVGQNEIAVINHYGAKNAFAKRAGKELNFPSNFILKLQTRAWMDPAFVQPRVDWMDIQQRQ